MPCVILPRARLQGFTGAIKLTLYGTMYLFYGLIYSTYTFNLLNSTFLVLHSKCEADYSHLYDMRLVGVATAWPVLEVRVPEVTCLSRMFS